MNSVRLQALKPNGNPHQSWDNKLVVQSGDWIITHSAYATPVRHHTKDLTYVMQHSNLGIFNTKEYFNVFLDFHKDGTFKMLYVNVATPAVLEHNQLSWTDLELDIVSLPGKPAEIVDQDEFEEAKASGLLSSDLADKTETVANTISQEVIKGTFPFLALDYTEVVEAIAKHLDCAIDIFPKLDSTEK